MFLVPLIRTIICWVDNSLWKLPYVSGNIPELKDLELAGSARQIPSIPLWEHCLAGNLDLAVSILRYEVVSAPLTLDP